MQETNPALPPVHLCGVTQLTESTVVAHLCARGVLAEPDSATVRTLSGGVSGTTFLVEAGRARYVVKQPLAYLAVADEWPARQERAGVEAAAIGMLERLTPAALPRLVDYDPETYVITMVAARPDWTDWREVLLRAEVDIAAGRRLGEVLATWHASTRNLSALERDFGDLTGFLELRGDPYHRTVAARRPELAGPVNACLDELLGSPTCLVHGDFSPKNVLIAAEGARKGLWVLDFEVAHAGNPVFDVAFMLHHLVMKAVHVPRARPDLRTCAEVFVEAYAGCGGSATDESVVCRHTGALLLARVHGKSPAAYLTEAEARTVSKLGESAVTGAVETLSGLWPNV